MSGKNELRSVRENLRRIVQVPYLTTGKSHDLSSSSPRKALTLLPTLCVDKLRLLILRTETSHHVR